MQALSSRPVRTCTIAFGDAEFDESAHAAAVAAHLGTDHLTLQAAPEDALALVPGLPHIWDEPFADSSQIPTALVCRLARRHVSVALSGDGGDELFAGYVRHVRGPGLWRRLRLTPRPLRWLLANGLRAWPAQAAWLARRAGLREAQLPNKLATLAACLDSAGEAGLYRAMTGLWRHRMPAAGRHSPLADSSLPDLRSRLQLWDQQGYLPDDILVKVDRAAMAASLETRVPLLDERIIAFAWSLPDRLRVANGQGKPILRRVAERRLTPGLLARPKRGFAIPLAAWLRGPLRGWAEELLVPARLADLPLDQADITTSWRRLLAGRQGDEHGLWAVLMLQAWRSTAR
jgi:asparagine synthase (glutamine-hydrolysing)